jgi:hypothetical protein
MCNFAQSIKEQNRAINKETSRNRIVLVKTIDKGDYFYIPQSAFSDTVDAVLFQDKTLLKVTPTNRPIKLSWTSACNDGDYILTITPEQIFFSSGHENPNPNYLFWVADISRTQFDLIAKGIRKKMPKGFIDITAPRTDSLFQDESVYHFFQKGFHEPCTMQKIGNNTNQNKFSTCCDTTISRQLVSYFAILNRYIQIDNEKVQLLNTQSWLNRLPKYFSYFEEEIHDWIGMRLH